jgi:predicted permease
VHGLLAVEAGFDGAHVLTMTPVMGASGMSGAAALAEKQRVVDAVEALAGVVAAGMTNEVPLSTPRPFAYAIEGQANPTRAQADLFWVEGRYFDALRIALREGRLFTRHDTAAAPAAIVSESLARRFSEARALGRRISVDGGPWLTVVGVVKDVRNVALDAPADEAIYLPLSLNPTHYVRLVARAAGDPLLLERPVRAAVRQIDPLVPIFHVQPMDDYVAASLARRRFALALMSCFGGLALLVACLGLYSVLGYTVSLRMPELGIRAALGATAWGLLGLILRSGVTLIGSGVLGGVLIAGVAMRSLESLLFGVRAFDLPTFVGAAATIAVAGIAASIVPARRAGRADALSVIRS